MKCQRCKEREANVQIVQQISGKKPQTFYLCDICARELGISIPTFPKSAKFTPNPFKSMSGVFATDVGLGADESTLAFAGTCPNCGITFDAFQKSGFLGCIKCYEAFGARLDPVFLRTQMGKEHVGRKLGLRSTHALPFDNDDKKVRNGKRDAAEKPAAHSGEFPPADQGVSRGAAKADNSAVETGSVTLVNDPIPHDAEEIAALERLHIEHLIEEKRQEMKDAIAVEDYRKAAALRDTIADLEKKKEGGIA